MIFKFPNLFDALNFIKNKYIYFSYIQIYDYHDIKRATLSSEVKERIVVHENFKVNEFEITENEQYNWEIVILLDEKNSPIYKRVPLHEISSNLREINSEKTPIENFIDNCKRFLNSLEWKIEAKIIQTTNQIDQVFLEYQSYLAYHYPENNELKGILNGFYFTAVDLFYDKLPRL